MGLHPPHPGPHPLFPQPRDRPAHPRGRTRLAQRQGRYADHGWHCDRRRHGPRLRRRPHRHPGAVLEDRIPDGGGRGGFRLDRLPRRLHQGAPATQPRLEQARQVGRATGLRARLRRARRALGAYVDRALVHPSAAHRDQSRISGLGDLRRPRHGGHVECGEHHRRSGRIGRRVGDVLLRRPLHHGVLDLPPRVHLPRASGVGDRPVVARGRPRRAPASASCGGTRRRPRSSWATRDPWASAPGWRRSACC